MPIRTRDDMRRAISGRPGGAAAVGGGRLGQALNNALGFMRNHAENPWWMGPRDRGIDDPNIVWRSPAPARGATRPDGKVYTGPDYGWQTPGSARQISSPRRLGSELTGGFGSGVAAAATVAPPAPALLAPGAAPAPRVVSAPAAPAPAALGARNVPIVTDGSRSRNAAASAAMQQAGLPAWRWDQNPSLRDAAQAAGEAAAAARGAQSGRGYLSGGGMPGQPSVAERLVSGFQETPAAAAIPVAAFEAGSPEAVAAAAAAKNAGLNVGTGAWDGSNSFDRVAQDPASALGAEVFSPGNRELLSRVSTPLSRPASALPDTSNPASAAYWQRADIQEWARANSGLARRLQERSGFTPEAATTGQLAQSVAADPATGSFEASQPARFDAPPPQEGLLAGLAEQAAEPLVSDPPADQRGRAFQLSRGYVDAIKRTNGWGI